MLLGCGDLNTVISADGSYRVGALVGTQGLEANALVRQGDSLRPVFLSKVADDPDLVGLAVVLKDERGAVLSDEVIYKLRSARAAADSDALVWVSRLDEQLPAFSLPVDLPHGTYSLYFRVLGSRGGLSESSVTFYYLKDLLFSVGSLRSYPPGEGPAATAPLFPPSLRLLLEVPVQAGPELDPHIRWTVKGKTIAEGKLSDGARFLLWETPKAEGFHEIRAEVFPERPPSGEGGRYGMSKRLSVAVSKAAPMPGGSEKGVSYLRLYRFLGTLSDELAPSDELTGTGAPEWLPGFDSYGLALGDTAAYTLRQPLFGIAADGTARGEVLLRFAVLGPGRIFRADFLGRDPTDAFSLVALAVEGGLRLLLESSGSAETLDLPLPGYSAPGFLTLRISMQVAPEGVAVSAGVGEVKSAMTMPLALGLPYSGGGAVVFGGTEHLPAEYSGTEGAKLFSETPSGYTAILDEFRQQLGDGL